MKLFEGMSVTRWMVKEAGWKLANYNYRMKSFYYENEDGSLGVTFYNHHQLAVIYRNF